MSINEGKVDKALERIFDVMNDELDKLEPDEIAVVLENIEAFAQVGGEVLDYIEEAFGPAPAPEPKSDKPLN